MPQRSKNEICSTTQCPTLTRLSLVSLALGLGITAFVIALHPQASQAQTARVMKVQGKRAIIKLDGNGTLQPGQTVQLGSSSDDSSPRNAWGGTQSREHIIGGSASIYSTTENPGSTSSTLFSVDGRYGWNRGDMEYGGLAGVRFFGTSGRSTREFRVGGFFDYNLVENRPGTELVYGGSASLSYSMLNDTTGTNTASGSDIGLTLGGQVKWFPFGSNIAIRGDAFYGHSSRSLRTDSTTGGFYVVGGFYIYF